MILVRVTVSGEHYWMFSSPNFGLPKTSGDQTGDASLREIHQAVGGAIGGTAVGNAIEKLMTALKDCRTIAAVPSY